MHSTTKLCIATVVGTLAVGSMASAATVSAIASAEQTVAGQDFSLSMTGLAPSDGTGGTLTLYARGDYEEYIYSIDEFIDLDAEGLFSAGPIGGFDGENLGVGVGGPFDFFNRFVLYRDVEFQITFSLSGSLLDALLADGQLDVDLNLSDNVALREEGNVGLTLNYNTPAMAAVPLPASLPLLIAGLGGFGMFKRRKKT